MTRKEWNVPLERPPEVNFEGLRGEKTRNDVRIEQTHGRQINDHSGELEAYGMVTGENEATIQVPEFLTGRLTSRGHLNESYDDINLDTTKENHPGCQTRSI